MQIKRGEPTANLCRLSLEISWETAQALSQLLPELAIAVQRLTNDHLEYTIKRDATKVDWQTKARKRSLRLYAIGRQASAELRRRVFDPSIPSVIRSSTVAEIAARNDISAEHLEALLKRQDKASRARLRRLRNARIVRLFAEGHSHGQIGTQVGLSPGRVAQIIRQYRSQVAARRRERMHVVADGATQETGS